MITLLIISKLGIFSGREIPVYSWLYHLTTLVSYDFIVHVSDQIHFKHIYQANYCTRDS